MTTYSASYMLGAAEGPQFGFGTVWGGQALYTMAKLALTGIAGWQGQPVWSYLSTVFPQYALGYSSLAMIVAANANLGSSPVLPNFNLELMSAISCAVHETCTVTGSGFSFQATHFSLSSSVVEQVTIPATGPYTYQAQNPGAATTPVVLHAGGLILGSSIPGSASQGVIDANGRIFTRVSSGPATGQYVIAANAQGWIYTFAAADAGLQVTVIDFAVGPSVNYCYLTTATMVAGSNTVTISPANVPSGGGQLVRGPGIAAGTIATGASGAAVTLSQPAIRTGSFAIVVVGAALSQVLGTPTVAGTFSLSVQPSAYGTYNFANADDGASIFIADVTDADPADSLTDYLSNPRYGAGFPTANIGSLSLFQDYAYANGFFISPAIVAAQAANSYLNDFATGLNCEFVWSDGVLSVAPYGDTEITGFGKTFAPPSQPAATFADDDYLKNEGTGGVGVSAFTSDDPVVCARTRPSDALNDVKVEYLDRGNSYNPAIVEAQDDAAIIAYGLRPADTKQLHFFCSAAPAMASAQLQLSRQQVRNLYSWTAPWYFIYLDPMDIVAINDAALGLVNHWVRIREITENQQDCTLTFTAEEYVPGSGTVPAVASQSLLGFAPNAGAATSATNTPTIFEPTSALLNAQVAGNLGSPTDGSGLGANGKPQLWIGVSPANGDPTWGGCGVYISFDSGTSYSLIGTVTQAANQGALTANLPSFGGSNPDTADTLSVDLGESDGSLPSSSISAATATRIICWVNGELLSYVTATPTTGNAYNLTTLYRGELGTTANASLSGSSFLLLDEAIFKYNLPANYVGTTLYFKFASFNAFGGGQADLSTITPVTYTPTGTGFAGNGGVTNVTNTTGTTLTANEVTGAGTGAATIVRSGPTAAFTDTMATASAIVATLTTPIVGTTIQLSLINTTAFAMTVQPGSGDTFQGNLTAGNFVIAANSSKTLTGQVTNVGTPAMTFSG